MTEVLSTVLYQAPAMLHLVADLVGLPRAPSYDVQTQVQAGEVRIDLQIIGLRDDGTRLWVLWSEHKVDDPLTARQLENESSALEVAAGSINRALIGVTLFQPTPDALTFASETDCRLFRWTHINQLARRALEADRREHSSRELPSVASYVLREWLEFARTELEAPVEPLTPDRVKWMPEIEKAIETIDHLLQTAFTRACEQIGAGTPREVAEELHAPPPEGSWLRDRGFTLLAKHVQEGGFGDVDGPCLVFGGWVEQADAVSARRSRDLHSVLGERGLSIWDEDDRHGGWIEFGIPVSLAELAAHTSLEEQDRIAGERSLQALQMLLAPIT